MHYYAAASAMSVCTRSGSSASEPMRAVHVCGTDTGNVYRTWACNASKHWDCRNSGARRGCSKSHYSKALNFFNVSAMFGAATAPAHPLRKCQNERLCKPPPLTGALGAPREPSGTRPEGVIRVSRRKSPAASRKGSA